MTSIGHNNPPADRNFKKRWAVRLFNEPKKPYGSIAMAFKIYVEMDGQGLGAVISDEEFRASCGVSDGSCRLFKKWLVDKDFIRILIRGQRGRKSEFQATIPGEIAATGAAIQGEIPAPNTGKPEEYRRPIPAIETGIPATAAAIYGLAAPVDAIAPLRARLESSLREDSLHQEKQLLNLPLLEQEAARGGGYDPDFPALNGTAIELVKFIGKSVNVNEREARVMLKANVQAFGAEPMLEAFAITLADTASKLIADPYKYLIGCARNSKDKPRGKGKEGEFDKIGRLVREANERQQPKSTQRRIT